MKLLTLDTATEACSCALYIDGDIQERSIIAPRKHAEIILNMIDELCATAEIKANQLDVIGFGRGPGSFTGVRIACGVAQGLAFALDLPVAPISCLATLAQGAYQDAGITQVLATLDARMGEIYYGFYEFSQSRLLMESMTDERVAKVEQIELPEKKLWYVVGNGWTNDANKLNVQCSEWVRGYHEQRYPQAKAMITLALAAFERGNVVDAEHAQPTYCREVSFRIQT